MAKRWWKDPLWWDEAFDRMIKSAAQWLIGAIAANLSGWFTQWYQLLISIGTGVLLSFLTSILVDPRDGAAMKLFEK